MIHAGLRMASIAALLGCAAPLTARTWTNAYGRTFEAELLRRDGPAVIFSLPDGRRFSMPLAELSPADQAAVQGGGRSGPSEIVAASFGKPWPREVRLAGPVPCKVVAEDPPKRRFIYESPGYRFTCDARVTDDALRNFAVMFEATRKYAMDLPLSLGGKPRDGKLDILLFGSQSAYVRAGGMPGSAGCFTRGVVMVPMESLGLKEGSTGFSLDISRQNSVLVHELAHQLTPDAYFAPGARGWFSEGLAEYLAVTPYNWGYFRPDIHGNAVKSHVTTRGSAASPGRALGTTIHAPRLRHFFLMPYGEFSGMHANHHYGLGLLVTHYFLHMADSGHATRITRFLKGLHAGAQGEPALQPLLNGGSYEKLEAEITAAWARMGVTIRFEKQTP